MTTVLMGSRCKDLINYIIYTSRQQLLRSLESQWRDTIWEIRKGKFFFFTAVEYLVSVFHWRILFRSLYSCHCNSIHFINTVYPLKEHNFYSLQSQMTIKSNEKATISWVRATATGQHAKITINTYNCLHILHYAPIVLYALHPLNSNYKIWP